MRIKPHSQGPTHPINQTILIQVIHDSLLHELRLPRQTAIPQVLLGRSHPKRHQTQTPNLCHLQRSRKHHHHTQLKAPPHQKNTRLTQKRVSLSAIRGHHWRKENIKKSKTMVHNHHGIRMGQTWPTRMPVAVHIPPRVKDRKLENQVNQKAWADCIFAGPVQKLTLTTVAGFRKINFSADQSGRGISRDNSEVVDAITGSSRGVSGGYGRQFDYLPQW